MYSKKITENGLVRRGRRLVRKGSSKGKRGYCRQETMQISNELLECNENASQSDSGTSVAGYDGARFYFAAHVRCTVLVSVLVRHCINVVHSLVY